MKQSRTIMGMPVVVEVVDLNITEEVFEEIFNYLISIDERFSPYKKLNPKPALDSTVAKYGG